ncbi:glycosyltransferase family 4 protein, partial [candidate division WOR-3 bacterium]|nr:glycosyltransferase family 4 protein [candidate division WOR-3 bacterium]
WGSDIRISYKNSTLFMKYLYNRAIKSSDYILTPGNYLLEYIPYKIKKVKETIWGIDIESLGEKNNNEKIKWGFKKNDIVITSIRVNRRIFQIKRIIDAVSRLQIRENRIHLNLIEGSYDDYNAEIRNYAKGKKFIQFYNLLNNYDYHSLLRASDIGLSLATTDAGPVSVKESMAIGLPIIFQSIFGIDRTIQNGSTGIGLNDISIESLEKRLHNLIYNRELYEKISENTKIHAMKNFDQKKYEETLETIYGLLLK